MTMHHLMSASVPQEARARLHELVRAQSTQDLHLQIVDLHEFLDDVQAMADSDNPIDGAESFEAACGVRPKTVTDFSYMETDDPSNGFAIRGFKARRYAIRNNGWWLNPEATLEDAVALVAA